MKSKMSTIFLLLFITGITKAQVLIPQIVDK